jgi:MSHA pilin protein MshD
LVSLGFSPSSTTWWSAAPFANPPGGWSGAATPANRQNFDDVLDYAGFATTGIYAITGAPIAGLETYTLSTTIAGTALGPVANTDSLRVTVTVTAPNTSIVLEGYKINVP